VAAVTARRMAFRNEPRVGEVRVRSEAPLGFDGAEVLDVPALGPAQVLPEPVEQGAQRLSHEGTGAGEGSVYGWDPLAR
jgi:hypothetical protein